MMLEMKEIRGSLKNLSTNVNKSSSALSYFELDHCRLVHKLQDSLREKLNVKSSRNTRNFDKTAIDRHPGRYCLNPLSPSIKLQIPFLCFHTFFVSERGFVVPMKSVYDNSLSGKLQ